MVSIHCAHLSGLRLSGEKPQKGSRRLAATRQILIFKTRAMPVEKHDINTENENENRKPTKKPGEWMVFGVGEKGSIVHMAWLLTSRNLCYQSIVTSVSAFCRAKSAVPFPFLPF